MWCAHIYLTCVCTCLSHNCVHIFYLRFVCTYLSHIGVHMCISHWCAHIYLTLVCTCLSHMCAHVKTRVSVWPSRAVAGRLLTNQLVHGLHVICNVAQSVHGMTRFLFYSQQCISNTQCILLTVYNINDVNNGVQNTVTSSSRRKRRLMDQIVKWVMVIQAFLLNIFTVPFDDDGGVSNLINITITVLNVLLPPCEGLGFRIPSPLLS